jgi:hypothetical protein
MTLITEVLENYDREKVAKREVKGQRVELE